MKRYYEIEERLKLDNTVTSELHMNEFSYYTYAPKKYDKYTTPNGLNVEVIESTYYQSGGFCIIRFRRI